MRPSGGPGGLGCRGHGQDQPSTEAPAGAEAATVRCSACVNEEKAPGLIQILCRLRDRWVSQQDKYAFVDLKLHCEIQVALDTAMPLSNCT